MAEPAKLRVEELSIDYRTGRGRLRAARGVSFTVAAREAVALIGESGSGKSTVALALLRLLPANAEVTEGSITFATPDGDVEIVQLGDAELRAFRWTGAALVPQGAISALNPVMRVSEHFRDTSAAHRGPTGNALEARAAELLRSVRLDPGRVYRAYPHELSGGMRQRVLIALALLLRPRVLILDEPTTAVDILTQRSILEVLHGLRETSDVSLVFISHDLAVAAELCDRIVTMYAGRAIEVAPTRRLMTEPRHPYTIALLRAIPSIDAISEELSAIPGSPPDLVDLPRGCPFVPRCPLATEICRLEDPALRPVGPDHLVACHHADTAVTLLREEVRRSA